MIIRAFLSDYSLKHATHRALVIANRALVIANTQEQIVGGGGWMGW